MVKLSTAQFKKRAQKIHKDKYDYSMVKYNGWTKKISIICPIHGLFEQQSRCHLIAKGCPKCGAVQSNVKRTLTTFEFVSKAIEIFGQEYDYSKVKYKNSSTKVVIVCRKHGPFLKIPANHLYGERSGCPECSKELVRKKNTLTTKGFLEKVLLKFGARYDYSKVIYKHSGSKIRIVCKKHGEFKQAPYHHLEGAGCPLCQAEVMQRYNKAKKLTTNQFITESKKAHKNRYDYSKSVYNGDKTKITIICPKHGEFIQRPSAHFNGQGCPKCQKSKGEILISDWLFKKNIDYIPQKRFKNCRGEKYPLPFDFFLPNKGICIEYDGPQHHYLTTFFEKDKGLALKKFKKTQHYDRVKDNYCLNNNIKLIRFRDFKTEKIADKRLTDKVLN